MVIYFSGTGNSRHCAERIARETGDAVINSNELIKKGEKGSFTSEKPYVFSAPTYAWQIPHVFDKFIRNSDFSGCKKAYFVMTCGDDIGCAAKKNRMLCENIGMEYMGTARIKMPENYIAMFDSPDEEREKEINRDAEKVLSSVITQIKEGKVLQDEKAGVADKLKSGIINKTFYKLFVKSKSFEADGRCISCGKCERLCPMNAIVMKDGKPQWGESCTHCMACISHCPTQAIEYGRKSVGKRRYTFNENNC